jgi:hypothetical protein
MSTGWQAPPSRHDGSGRPRMPRWSLPALLLGIACSLATAWISVDAARGQTQGEGPSIAMVYMLRAAPFLLVGLPLMLIGSVGAVRPWSRGRPWLPWASSGAVVLWFLLVVQGPTLLMSDPHVRGTGTVDGLPGQGSPWSGAVECRRAGGSITTVVARVPVAGEGATMEFEVLLDVLGGDGSMVVGDAASGGGSYAGSARFEASEDRAHGQMAAFVQGILHRDDPPSVVAVTWDCGPLTEAP